MKQKRVVSIIVALALILQVVMPSVLSPLGADAATKPKLGVTKVSVEVGQTKKVLLKNAAKASSVVWTVSNSKIATLTKKTKTVAYVKAISKGTTALKCKVKIGAKTYNLSIPVSTSVKVVPTVKPVVTAKPVVTVKPTVVPTATPVVTVKPTVAPVVTATPVVTVKPTAKPTVKPTAKPTVAPTIPPVQSNYLTATFETGIDGFVGRGASAVAQDADAYLGSKGAKVTGRTANWNGIGIDLATKGVKVVESGQYKVTAYVKQNTGSSQTMKATYDMQETAGGSSVYMGIASGEVPSGTWTKIEGTFVGQSPTTAQFLVYFESDAGTFDFSIDNVSIDYVGMVEVIEPASIKDAYAPIYEKMGNCINYSQLLNPTTLAYFKKNYNSFTLENEMKPENLLKNDTLTNISSIAANSSDYVVPSGYTETQYARLNFSTIDNVLKIAYDNGLKMRAHTLVWHSQTPEWFFKTNFSASGTYVTPAVMNKRLEMYVRSVIHHVYTIEGGKYKDVVYAWDVANEYLHNYSNVNWSKVYGNREGNLKNRPPYVKLAFETAYQELIKFGLVSTVKLFYNDFNTYVGPTDVVELINYINEGESAKICAGIGMQSHLDVDYPTAETYGQTIRMFANAGFEIQITELDATINCNNGNYSNQNQTNEDQATYVGAIMKEVYAQKKAGANITGITIWGLYDGISWRSQMSPTLFGTGLRDMKPSFDAFMNAVK